MDCPVANVHLSNNTLSSKGYDKIMEKERNTMHKQRHNEFGFATVTHGFNSKSAAYP